MTYLLLGREEVSSLDFCFPDTGSLERVALIELLVERVTLEVEGSDEVAADGCSERDKSRSLPLPLSLLFCFAALTLALERKFFDSNDDTAVDESRSCGFDTDALELLVASCGWIGCKSIYKAIDSGRWALKQGKGITDAGLRYWKEKGRSCADTRANLDLYKRHNSYASPSVRIHLLLYIRPIIYMCFWIARE